MGAEEPVLEITQRDARRLLLSLQGLARDPRGPLPADALQVLVEELGYVQVDTISAVERAHHHILFTRARGYRREDLARLLERDRSLFEHWTHDASIIPTRWFPYWRHRFERFRTWYRNRPGFKRRLGGEPERILGEVKEHVRANGPTRSRDFEREAGTRRGTWWDWHPAKAALEVLWRTGELAVAGREGFQKIYDLTERVIPDAHRAKAPPRASFVDFACREALRRLGVATPAEIAGFFALVTLEEAKDWCAREAGRAVLPVTVENGANGRSRTSFARPDIEALLADLPDPPGGIRLLNPFDPVIRDRARLERLFGFDYRIEVFVPEAKRQYGYYVLPILEGGRFIGRLDPKLDRGRGILTVNGLWLEPGVRMSKARERRLLAELDRFRRFLGADEVSFAPAAARVLQS